MNKKSLLSVLGCYVMWGALPLYWRLLANADALFVLANRIVWSAVFTVAVLLITGRMKELIHMLRSGRTMRLLIPASIFITLNWGIYIWAVGHNRVIEASLGYYMNPLMVFFAGILVFKERCGRLERIALLLATVGVIYSTLQFGEFPFVAVLLAVLFSIYGVFKKFAHVDGFVSVAAETVILTPAALVFLLFWPHTAAQLQATTTPGFFLLVFAGVVTAIPLVLYTKGVNDLPFVTMGFLQYASPTLMLIIGMLVMGEEFTAHKAVSFAFIWAGLILFMVAMVRRERAQKAEKAADTAPASVAAAVE